jgi:adenylate cyclase
METPVAYIPIDRRHALAAGRDLPERSIGAALFADISGFTPLTEALVRVLGPQRGADALPQQLNVVYAALIAEVDRHGGAVLSFAGDAITCWFDEQYAPAPQQEGAGAPAPPPPAAHRAAACGLALQTALAGQAAITLEGVGTNSLAIKVGIASGPARRFMVGDPGIQTMDVLAGETIQPE